MKEITIKGKIKLKGAFHSRQDAIDFVRRYNAHIIKIKVIKEKELILPL